MMRGVSVVLAHHGNPGLLLDEFASEIYVVTH